MFADDTKVENAFNLTTIWSSNKPYYDTIKLSLNVPKW